MPLHVPCAHATASLALPPLPLEFPRAELQAKGQRAAGQGALKGRLVLPGRSRGSSSGEGTLPIRTDLG